MKQLIFAVVLALVGCEGVPDEEMAAAPDDGVFVAKQAVVPGPTIRLLEDKRLSNPASTLNYAVLQAPGNGGLNYYFNGGDGTGHVWFDWEYKFSDSPTITVIPNSSHHPGRALTDVLNVGSGLWSCIVHQCVAMIATPMADSTVFHSDDTTSRDWWPTGIPRPQVRPPHVLIARRYRFQCPNGSFAPQVLGEGPWTDLSTAPDTVVTNDWTQGTMPGIFQNSSLWREIANYCGFGAEAFGDRWINMCDCNRRPTLVSCQIWPGPGSCLSDPDEMAMCNTKCGIH